MRDWMHKRERENVCVVYVAEKVTQTNLLQQHVSGLQGSTGEYSSSFTG
jgi:hypothetical protein